MPLGYGRMPLCHGRPSVTQTYRPPLCQALDDTSSVMCSPLPPGHPPACPAAHLASPTHSSSLPAPTHLRRAFQQQYWLQHSRGLRLGAAVAAAWYGLHLVIPQRKQQFGCHVGSQLRFIPATRCEHM
eukprot:365642-Chlamydomonas_euryale.AAC.7